MIRIITIISFFLLPVCVSAQGEMLLLKKHGKVQKSYFPGSRFVFDAGMGWQQAEIYDLKNDSVFLVQYQVRQVLTTLGTLRPDTIGTYRFELAVGDIQKLAKERKGWSWSASGASLFGGGILLTTGGLLTWVLSSKNGPYYASTGFVITSAALAATGFLLMQVDSKRYKLGNKYTLEFIGTH